MSKKLLYNTDCCFHDLLYIAAIQTVYHTMPLKLNKQVLINNNTNSKINK